MPTFWLIYHILGLRRTENTLRRNLKKTTKTQAKLARMASDPANITPDISPELVPIVTLLSAQGHRHYLENNFMLLQDLNNEGQPADRKWTEVYGVLSGIQLAIWDAKTLSNARKLKNKDLSVNKPFYLNLGDANFKCMDALPSTNGKPLNNVISISTTLKNRYILQFKSKEMLTKWHCAIRLANFEYVSLQEAYTASLLSSKGAKLSDIRVILAESKYNYQHWISVRFGAGTTWERYFAVVDLNPKKSKKSPNKFGKIILYEHDKIKKSPIIAEITFASRAYAAYPNATIAIDSSSLVKIDGKVVFTKSGEKEPRDSSVFIMPEAHAHVPGYDTLIRFLIPTLDAFHLYGRPTKLNADKMDPSSLLFGLPVLPHVHYLELDDVFSLVQSNPAAMTSWSDLDWFANLKSFLKQKMVKGYNGCGSVHGISGALKSPVFGGSGSNIGTPISPNFDKSFKYDDKNEYHGIDENLNKSNMGNDAAINPFDNGASGPTGASQQISSVPQGIPNPGVPNPYGHNGSINNTNNMNPYGMGPAPSGSGVPPMNGTLQIASDSSASLSGHPKVKNQELPLPSDSMNPQVRNMMQQQNQYAPMTQGSIPSPARLQNMNVQKENLELPLPSDIKKISPNNNPNNSHPQIAKIQTNYDYNSSSLMSSSSAIRSAAALKSAAALSETMDRLSIHKEVDDTVFNVLEMLAKASSTSSSSEAKKGSSNKKYKGREIDMFNPAYSEALLSPAVDTNF